MTPERTIQRQIMLAWGAHPRIRFARVNTGVGWFARGQPARRGDPGARPVRFNPKGTADLVGLIAPTGRLLMIEVKAPGGKQSAEQRVMERVITTFGGLYVVAYSVEDVTRALGLAGVCRGCASNEFVTRTHIMFCLHCNTTVSP